jgi:peptidoglycan/LPS O-acetylase OafA/YrhL
MIKRLLMLNGLAIVCAVVNHAVVWELTAMFWWADRYMPTGGDTATQLESWRFFSVRLIDQLVFPAVFAFLFISGYFIAVAAGRKQKTIPWRLVLQRVKFLLIPYLLWTAVILALNVLQRQSYTPWDLLKIVLLGGASPPYYYVILLVQLYVLSPLFVPLARDRWKTILLFTGLLQLITLVAHYLGLFHVSLGLLEPVMDLLRNWHLIGYAFWFVLGTVVGFHLQDFRPGLFRWRRFLLIATLVTLVVGFVEWGAVQQLSGREWISPQIIVVNRLYVLFLLLTFLAFENMPIPFSSLFSKLGPKSYGIYLVHVIPLELAARLLYHIAPALLAYQIIFMPLLVLAGVSVPVIMMEVVNRSFIRQYYKYIFG